MNIFEKIIARQIPADIVYEDDHVLAFRDIHPQAPVHVLVIPKRVILNVGAATDADRDLLGRLMLAAKAVAEKEGLVNGYRVVTNTGPDGGQSVDHLHLHVLGKRQMRWPPG